MVLEEVDTEAALGAETAMLTIVRVEAGSVVVEADGANYAPLVKRESKKERRSRQQEDAREQHIFSEVGGDDKRISFLLS